MTKHLDIAINKKLPLDILMQPVALLAQRGWGKTVTAKGCYEAAHDAGAQCITVFPTGKWWSLRLAADGKSPGLTDVFVIGGPHGDVPLTPGSGKVVAKLLVEKRIHAVLDVSLLRKGERHRFLADFFEEFWLLKKLENDNYPVVIFIEEAHAIAPQTLRQGQLDEARMLGAVEDLAAEGRNHGIGIVLLDQRSARVNKNIIALVEVLICGRIGYPSDRKIIGEWVVDKGAEDLEWLKQLPRLKPGEAYVYAPVLDVFERLQLRMARTFNATATAKIGERTFKAGALTQVDISGLKESMATVIAEAEKDDPRALKKEIARLQAELAKKPQVMAPVVETKYVNVIGSATEEHIRTLAERLDAVLKQYAPTPKTTGHLITQRTSLPQPPRAKNGFTAPIPKRTRFVTEVQPSTLGRGERAILTAIAQHPDGVSREQLSVLTGYKRSSRDTYLQKLFAAELVSQSGEYISVSGDGLVALGPDFEPLPTGSALRQHWLQRLPEGEKRILQLLVEQYPNPMQRDEISDATGYKRSSRDTYLQKLSARKLVEASRGSAVASGLLFDGAAA